MQLWPGEPAGRLRHHRGHDGGVDAIGVDGQIKFPAAGYVLMNSIHAYFVQRVSGGDVGAMALRVGHLLRPHT